MKRRLIATLTALGLWAAMMVVMAAPALAWHANGYGDCDGWYITNPAENWNSAAWTMRVDATWDVAYSETLFVGDTSQDGRSFSLYWYADFGTGRREIEHQTIQLARETGCNPTTTTTTTTPTTSTTTVPPTTTGPPSSSTTTTIPSPTTTTTEPPFTCPPGQYQDESGLEVCFPTTESG